MEKYISMLILAAVAGTAMAQQSFQPKHPGIMARQFGLGQEKEVSLAPKLYKSANKPVAKTRAVAADVLQLDSVYVTRQDEVKEILYYYYYPNGTVSKELGKRHDIDGNWIETRHNEWTEDFPQKGSSMTEYGYDTLGVYGAIHKYELLDDYETSYCEYYGNSDQLKPVLRVSSTWNEYKLLQSVAYYYYDEKGNELPDDSVAYSYDDKGRLVRETYFLADKSGQLDKLGYFETTYDQVVETPSGPGKLMTTIDSDMRYRSDSIISDDQNYKYYASYSKDGQAEWQKQEERITCVSGFSSVETHIHYIDNAVEYGRKTESKSERTNTGMKVEIREYSCNTDTTQWLLLSLLEDDYSYELTADGRESVTRQSYYTEADENGVLHDIYDAMLFHNLFWEDAYTCVETEYYQEEDKETSEYITSYYHNPDITGISVMEVLPNDGVQFDLSGRRLDADQRGKFMIKNGRVILNK